MSMQKDRKGPKRMWRRSNRPCSRRTHYSTFTNFCVFVDYIYPMLIISIFSYLRIRILFMLMLLLCRLYTPKCTHTRICLHSMFLCFSYLFYVGWWIVIPTYTCLRKCMYAMYVYISYTIM